MKRARSSEGDEETPRQNGSSGRRKGMQQHRGNEDDDEDSGLGTSNLQDDDNDPNLRREIRSKYRDLINSLQQEREDLLSPSSNKLTEVLEEANRLFQDVREAREAALDAHLLVVATDLGKEKASQLVSEGTAFDPTAFTEHLLTFMGLNRLEDEEELQDGETANGYLSQEAWHRVAKRAESCFKTAPSFHYMMGSFHAEPPPPKQRIERQRKAPSKEAKRMMPTQLKKMEESHQEATEKEVERILGFLRGYHKDDPSNPISYYEFVINPNSFSRTVENMFHTSFLIRDGLARMYLDDKLPCIAPVEEGDVEAGESTGNKQCIISISQKTWKELIEAFDITETLIPPPDTE